jgi:putative ABC transport system permease protein
MGMRLRRLGYVFRQRRRDAELAEEIEFHRSRRQLQLESSGLEGRAAIDAAARSLGNLHLAREDARRVWMSAVIDDTWQDIRYAVRTLARSPGFALVALFTLMLGIGANTAMFSVVNAVLLRPLPFADPDRLVMIWTSDPARNIHESATSFPTFMDWRQQSRSFAEMAFWRTHAGTLTGGDEPERVVGVMASSNLFPLLGVTPAAGRTFSASDEQSRQAVVVISHRLWQRRFGSSSTAIGQSIEIDGHRLEVIGVMPDGFYFPTKEVQHWIPASLHGPWAAKPSAAERSWTDRFADLWHVFGRLKTAASLDDAREELATIGRRLAEIYPRTDPDFVGFGTELVPMLDQITGRSLRRDLWILLGAVGFVLLIACANVAHLVLARGAARSRELAVRAALGAGLGRLMRQLLVENAVLTILAAGLGVGVAAAALRAVTAAASGIPRLDEVAIDLRVLTFTILLAVVAGLLSGIAPAWRLSRGDPGDAQKHSLRATAGAATVRTRGTLVVVECALAVALLAGAGLLIRSFLSVRGVNPGFDERNVLLARVNLPIPVSPTWRQQEWQTFAAIEERLAGLPGIHRVGAITNFMIARNPEEAITVEGRTDPRAVLDSTLVNTDDVTPGFFQAMGVPLLKGRFFRPDEQNARVAIVNEAFARRFFVAEDPVGRRFKEGGPDAKDAWITIVGVVANMHRQGLEQLPIPEFFFASSEPTMDIAIRTTGDPSGVAAIARDTIRSIHPSAMIVRMTTVEDLLGERSAQRRFQTWLLALFAGAALMLSAVGVYGILHFTVEQRTHEFGVRLALGANHRQLLAHVIRSGMRLPAVGVSLGLAAALGLTRVLDHLLFQVSATDPLTFGGVAVLLLLVAFAACWIPARRASRVDPIVALRAE